MFQPNGAGEFEKMKATRPFALTIGVMNRMKNPLEVIEIARAVPGMDFILIGSPWDKGLVAKFVSSKPKNVRYLGAVAESTKLRLIERCAMGLTTSLKEEFGWIPFEFLTRGKPVVGRPLASFLEIYGDMMIYAKNVEEFRDALKKLCNNRFKWSIDLAGVRKLREKYTMCAAAKRILRISNARVIITPDLPVDSDYISGLYLVDWEFWKAILRLKDDVMIFSNGIKFSAQFGLLDRSIMIPSAVRTIRQEINRLRFSSGPMRALKSQVLTLALAFLEPICFIRLYDRYATHTDSSPPVIATEQSQILAAAALKIIYHARVTCLLHVVDFYGEIWKATFLAKVYNMIFVYCLRIMDHILVVSHSLRDDLLRFYPHNDKVLTVWG